MKARASIGLIRPNMQRGELSGSIIIFKVIDASTLGQSEPGERADCWVAGPTILQERLGFGLIPVTLLVSKGRVKPKTLMFNLELARCSAMPPLRKMMACRPKSQSLTK